MAEATVRPSSAQILRPEGATPHDAPAEICVLGSMILENASIPKISETLRAQDFFLSRHARIFDVILAVHKSSGRCDAVTLRGALSDRGILDDCGGYDYLAELLQVPNAAAWGEYAGAVLKCARKRTTLKLANAMLGKIATGIDCNGDFDALREAYELSQSAAGVERIRPRTFEAILEEGRLMAAIQRIASCIPGLDAHLSGGYAPGWFVVAGAFTGCGKTTYCIREAVHLAGLGHPVLYLSCELAALEIARKVEAASYVDGAGIPHFDTLYIEDRLRTLAEMKHAIEEWSQSQAPSGRTAVVLLDYLQRVIAPARPTNREREVAIIAEEMQGLARRLGIVLIAAAQLNRQSQTDEEPSLRHMRESGLIEQTADIAILLAKDGDDRLTVHLAKNRWGPSGAKIELSADFARCRFGPLTHADQWKALAEAVYSHLVCITGRREKIREVCRAVWWSGRHPKLAEIIEAAAATQAYQVGDGQAWIP